MDKYPLKLATRELLARFASLQDAASHCRVSPPNLSQYQNPDHSAYMPIDVVADLEARAGTRPVSRALGADAALDDASVENVGGALDEALDLLEAVNGMIAHLRRVSAAGGIRADGPSPNQRRAYEDLRQQVESELRQLDVAVRREGILPFREVPAADERPAEPVRLTVVGGDS